MKKKLLIVESPNKVKTIEKIFNGEVKVMASVGHIKDLPTKSFGVSIDNGKFVPEFEISGNTEKDKKRKKEIINKIKREAKKYKVILASDPDREGEAIAWHLAKELKIDPNDKVRIRFNEVTKSALKSAIQSPDSIDMNKVNSQFARRILDRIVGYKISPLLWRIFKGKWSAGRVQSATLKLIIDLENKIAKFIPEEYWQINSNFNFNGQKYLFDLYSIDEKIIKERDIKTKSDADKIESLSLNPEEYKIYKIDKKKSYSKPPTPYITNTLQQDAARILGFSLTKTMRVAQRLYEGVEIFKGENVALITYMRTDSTRLSEEARERAQKYITSNFGKDFLGSYKVRNSSSAQDAHEAIRPTYPIKYTPELLKTKIDNDLFKLYDLIWRRFMASQMKSASYNITNVYITNGKIQYKLQGRVEIFKGYKILYTPLSKEEEKYLEIPDSIKEGEKLHVVDVIKKQKFTKPPSRFTESSLVAALRQKGIGRPSTYSMIPETLKKRKYVVIKGPSRSRTIYPTVMGYLINRFLESSFSDIIEVKFTAYMEEQLDKIEKGQIDKDKMLNDFIQKFDTDMKLSKEAFKKVKIDLPTNLNCECGGNYKLKIGKYGIYAKCDKCGKNKTLPKDKPILYFEGKADIKDLDTSMTLDEVCPLCGSPLTIKIGRFGRFVACTNYPECKFTKPYEEVVGKCPECGGKVLKLRSKKGRTYYKCKECKKVFFNLKDILPLEG